MKIQNTIITLLLLSSFATVAAAPIDQVSARQKAAAFLQKRGIAIASEAPTPTTRAGLHEAFYVFNAENDKGFVIISGDDCTDEVLGYTDTGHFDADNLPDNFKAWLQGYADQVTLAAQGSTSGRQKVATHSAISPLVTSQWNQGAPYNSECPGAATYGIVTGCVATAMAQVMYYHQWPQEATSAIAAYTTKRHGLSASALAATTFNWASMKDRYTASESAGEVAKLMRYCGQSVQMDYSQSQLGGSSASSSSIPNALTTYFGYDAGVKCVERTNYTIASWDQLIYDELAAGRPVIYSGLSSGGGHSFICDGYDGDGLYHVNWGWGGLCDGYFKLSLMNPDTGGAGASTTKDGYSISQDAIIGIQKPTGNPVTETDVHMTTTVLTVENGTSVKANFYNMTGKTRTFDFGLGYIEDGKITAVKNGYYSNRSTNDRGGYSITVPLSGRLSDGTYKIIPISKLSSTSTWIANMDDAEYIEAVVSSNGASIKLTEHHAASATVSLAATSFDYPGDKYVGSSQEVKVTIQNNGDEYNGVVYLFASTTSSLGSSVNHTGLAVEAGASETVSMYFTPASRGTYNISVATDEAGSNIIGTSTVVINSAPTAEAKLAVESYKIEPGTTTTFTVNIKNNGTDNYQREIIAFLFPGSGGNSLSYKMSTRQDIAPGASAEITFTFTEDDELEKGKEFIFALYYYKTYTAGTNQYTKLGNANYKFTVPDASGIDVISAELQRKPANVYTIDGKLVRVQATTLRGLPAGIYVVNGKKIVINS